MSGLDYFLKFPEHPLSMEPIILFFYKWPRNFAISFAVEALIAQPIARLVMLKLHQLKDTRLDVENI